MKSRIAIVDILKAVSMILVLIGHTGWEESQRNILGFPFWVDMAVPIFMILSGFVFAMQFYKRNVNSIDEAYSRNYILKNLLRFLIPFLPVYLIEAFACIYVGFFKDTGTMWAGNILLDFVRGGSGVGSYYMPVMIQFVFLYPLIWKIFQKSKHPNFVMLIITLSFELIKFVLYIPESGYRLLIFRYIFLIGFGTYLYIKYSENDKMNTKCWLLAPVGAFFIITTSYWGYKSHFFCYWTGTCVIASMFIMPFVGWTLNAMCSFKFRLFEMIGKASYHIFMVQQVWFWFGAQVLLFPYVQNQFLRVLISCLVCVIAGGIYWKMEGDISRKLIKKLIPNL